MLLLVRAECSKHMAVGVGARAGALAADSGPLSLSPHAETSTPSAATGASAQSGIVLIFLLAVLLILPFHIEAAPRIAEHTVPGGRLPKRKRGVNALCDTLGVRHSATSQRHGDRLRALGEDPDIGGGKPLRGAVERCTDDAVAATLVAQRRETTRQQDWSPGGSAVAWGVPGSGGGCARGGQSLGGRGPRAVRAADAPRLLLVPGEGTRGSGRRAAS